MSRTLNCPRCKRYCNKTDFIRRDKKWKTCQKCSAGCKIYRDTHIKDINEMRLHNMVHHTKTTDTERNRFNANKHIDKNFIIQQLNKQNNKCIYCLKKIKLDAPKSTKRLATIERKNNSIGHFKSNCVMACYNCNMIRGKRMSFEDFIKLKRNK